MQVAIKPEPVKTYRHKKIQAFLDKHFPVKPIKIPTPVEIRASVLGSANGAKVQF